MNPTLTVEGTVQHQELRALVSMYYDIQRFRVGGSNRKGALVSTERLDVAVAQLKGGEQQIAKLITDAIKDEPLAIWPLAQRGIGPILAAALIASNLDPTIDKPSAWWRFAGVGIVNGHNQRKHRGEKVTYNMFLRRTLYVLVGSFLKAGGFYADLYYRFKEESQTTRPDLKPSACKACSGSGKFQDSDLPCRRCSGKGEVGSAIHHHLRAMLLVQRVFLTHLQVRWREALGLPPPRFPYIHAGPTGDMHELIAAP